MPAVAGVAQLVEQWFCKPQVGGSSPSAGTTRLAMASRPGPPRSFRRNFSHSLGGPGRNAIARRVAHIVTWPRHHGPARVADVALSELQLFGTREVAGSSRANAEVPAAFASEEPRRIPRVPKEISVRLDASCVWLA